MLAELLQVGGGGHRTTNLPQNVTCFYSHSWYVLVTLEREETSAKSNWKKAPVLKQEYLVLYG